jgi:hypothetical protein
MEIVIEKGIPLVDKAGGKWPQAEVALKKMEIGDSFLFAATHPPSVIYGMARGAGVSVKISKVADGQYRIWRKA